MVSNTNEFFSVSVLALGLKTCSCRWHLEGLYIVDGIRPISLTTLGRSVCKPNRLIWIMGTGMIANSNIFCPNPRQQRNGRPPVAHHWIPPVSGGGPPHGCPADSGWPTSYIVCQWWTTSGPSVTISGKFNPPTAACVPLVVHQWLCAAHSHWWSTGLMLFGIWGWSLGSVPSVGCCVRHCTEALVYSNHPRAAAASSYLAIIFGQIASGLPWFLRSTTEPMQHPHQCWRWRRPWQQ